MIVIKTALPIDIPIIHDLAHKIWWPTYRGIISDEQIDYMLQDMYAKNSLLEQMKDGHHFKIISFENSAFGFCSFSPEGKNGVSYKIHKLYIDPLYHGKGYGKLFVNDVFDELTKLGADKVLLNVNRGNNAQHFYKKLGFVIIKEVNIRYHEFVLNDYVMEKTLHHHR